VLLVSDALSDVAKYLSEAATSIFKPTKSDVPWEGSGSPFSGASLLYALPVQACLAPTLQVRSVADAPKLLVLLLAN
jgi:uncharacterized lipoprotein YbaY